MNRAWSRLREYTPARVALGRCGDGVPTDALLDFQLAHARARDAVWAELDESALRDAIRARLGADTPVVAVESRATERRTYLQRPDLGRELAPAARGRLERGRLDLVVVVADGLSATAVQTHAPETAEHLLSAMPAARVAPIVVARQSRVALGDEVGFAVGARLAIVLIGERPGLSSCDSLGAYLTFDPRPGLQNHQRNCVSNIRTAGFPPAAAGRAIAALAQAALSLRLSGIGLKDRSGALAATADDPS